MPNQFPATQANPAAMYMPTIPPAVASSPQHQPHMYHQNVNQQSIPPMQVIDMNLSNRYFANKIFKSQKASISILLFETMN